MRECLFFWAHPWAQITARKNAVFPAEFRPGALCRRLAFPLFHRHNALTCRHPPRGRTAAGRKEYLAQQMTERQNGTSPSGIAVYVENPVTQPENNARCVLPPVRDCAKMFLPLMECRLSAANAAPALFLFARCLSLSFARRASGAAPLMVLAGRSRQIAHASRSGASAYARPGSRFPCRVGSRRPPPEHTGACRTLPC